MKAALGAATVKYCWIIYLKNIVRNPIVASRFHHSVGVQLPVFDILFVLNISAPHTPSPFPSWTGKPSPAAILMI